MNAIHVVVYLSEEKIKLQIRRNDRNLQIHNQSRYNIDKFDYAYVHLHVQFPKIGILGIHLVKEADKNVLLDHLVICSPFNLNNSLDIVAQHLHYKGNTLVVKIDMNLMLDSTQQKILDIILK